MITENNTGTTSLHRFTNQSKLWIYQANRFLTDDECALIKQLSDDFIKSWAAHGAKLYASIEVEHKIFLLIAVDEDIAIASGCSIDKSVHFVKAIENKLNIQFFDRMQIAYIDAVGEIKAASIANCKKLFDEGKIQNDTLIFNNLVQNIEEYKSRRLIPLKDSWVINYL
jgi:hypothetical protein